LELRPLMRFNKMRVVRYAVQVSELYFAFYLFNWQMV
jgi:hypothetical protein